MNDPSIEDRIRILRNIGFRPEALKGELDANFLIAQIEGFEGELGIKPERPIRQRVKIWRNCGWHPQRMIDELEAQAKILQIKSLEKKARKRKGEMDEPNSPKFPMTSSQVAGKLGVSKDTLRRWLDDLRIDPPKTRGGHIRINHEIFKKLEKNFMSSARF